MKVKVFGKRLYNRAGAVVQAFAEHFDFHWTTVLRLKLGLDDASGGDRALADDYLTLLRRHRIDFTLAFARLADAAQGNNTPLRTLFGGAAAALELWLKRWRERTLAIGKSPDELAAALRSANPIYIPRNHHVESALAAAHLRFRPIIMTSLAFILGVVPLAIASGASSASQRAIGTGVISGMVVGTFLAVFFVPIFFVIVRSLFKGSARQRQFDAQHSHQADTGNTHA